MEQTVAYDILIRIRTEVECPYCDYKMIKKEEISMNDVIKCDKCEKFFLIGDVDHELE